MAVVEGTGVGQTTRTTTGGGTDQRGQLNDLRAERQYRAAGSHKPKAGSTGSSGNSGSSGSSGSGGSGGSGGGGGGGSSADRAKQYLWLYRQMLDNKSATPPKSLIQKAVANKWSAAYFQLMVRKTDDGWLTSPEAMKRKQDFKSSWLALMGKGNVSAKMSDAYARSKLDSKTFWANAIKVNKNIAKQFKYWNAYNKGQAAMGDASVANDPFTYAKYRAAFADAYKQLGIDAPQDYERLYFRSGQTPQQFTQNLSTLMQTSAAFQWATGTAAPEKKVLFNQKGSAGVRGRLQSALKRQRGFFAGETVGFDAQRDQTTGLVKQSI